MLLTRHVGYTTVLAATAARSERFSPGSATSATNLARSAQRARARWCTTAAYLVGSTASASGCDGSAPGAVRGPDGNNDSRESRLRRARGVLCDRQSSDDGENPSLVVGARTRRHRFRAATRARRQLTLLLRSRVAATALRWGPHAEWATAMIRLRLVFGMRAAYIPCDLRSSVVDR